MNLKGDSILLLENINTGSRLKQGDKTTLKFRLRDRDGEPMAHLRNTVATAYLLRNGVTYYKTDTEPITDDLVAKFKIDEVLPAGKYHVEIETIDGIFPSDDKTNFDISKSNRGLDQNVIEVYGIDAVVNKVVDKVAFDSAPSNISAEVIAARKGEPNLRQSIEKIEQNLENKKADKAEVSAQLAQNVRLTKRLNQNDYVEFIKANTQYDKVKFKKIDDNKFVFVAHNSKKAVAYHMVKDVNGEHFRLSLSQLANVVDKEINKHSATLTDVTGNWNTANAENWIAYDVGDTFKANVVGDTLYFGHYADNRGGIWEIVIDGDEKNKIVISTYSDTAISFKKSLITDGLEYKTHSVVGTFKGDDPSNPPSGGVARGWLKTGGTPSNPLGTLFGHESEFIEPYADVLEENVIIDMAISMKVGSSAVNWIPEHNKTGTVFTLNTAHPLQLFVDGNSINGDNFETGKWYWCNCVTVFQNLEVRLPDVTEPVAQLKRSHTLNKDGVMSYSASIYFLQDTTVHAGYPLMLSANEDIFSTFVTGLGNTFISKNDDTYTFAEEEENINVNLALVSGSNRHYIVACKMLNPYTTFRVEKENTPIIGQNQLLWNREFAPKYYFKALEMTPMATGKTYNFSGQFAIAEIYRIRDYI